MRRVLLFMLFGLWIACWPARLWAEPVGQADAREVVVGWLALEAQPLGVRLGDGVAAVASFAGDDGSPAYYVVSLAPAGFVVVPADDAVEPILAFSATGAYDASPETPLGALVGGDVPHRVAWARAHPARRGASGDSTQQAAQAKWVRLKTGSGTRSVGLDSLSDVRVAPLVASTWNQSFGPDGKDTYNLFTPNRYYCGCTATAMAQVMRYHRHPTAGVGTGAWSIRVCGEWDTRNLRGGDGQGGPYQWDDMVLRPDAATTQAQREAISALTADIGLSVHMNYCATGSSAYPDPEAFTGVFGYATAREATSAARMIEIVSANLDAGYPAILGITSTASSHAVVADGYGYDAATLYHHINMGWGGAEDLWYNLPVIGTSGEYQAISNVTYDIFPDKAGEIISGRVLDKAGAPIGGAVVAATTDGLVTATAVSNAKGIYALVGVPLGALSSVAASKSGYSFAQRELYCGVSSRANPSTLWGIDFQDGVKHPKPAVTPQVSAGRRFSLALDGDGRVYAWGDNDGAFGDGTLASSAVPVPVHYPGELYPRTALAGDGCGGGIVDGGAGYVSGKSLAWNAMMYVSPTPLAAMASIKGLTSHYRFALFVGTDGLVYGAGDNGSGQLGDGTTTARWSTFRAIAGLNDVTQVASGDDHALALRADGTVWAWGSNILGQLGDGSTTTRLSPVAVSTLPAIAAIAASGNRSLALAKDGTVWVWGSSLGATPVRMAGLAGMKAAGTGDYMGAALKSDGTVWYWSWSGVPQRVAGLSGIVSLSVGGMHVLALGADGRIWGFGDNGWGQLSDACPSSQCDTPVLLSLRLAATPSGGALLPALPLLLSPNETRP
ncbi:MAG: C10 family peptidase [Solidesulfovibrio sp. DCME]|uniref:C10 family peptidase n=1 Tax=Solidesulfovibrio sp. DCME TaxID=3447380 RepID=UPI003D123D29